MTENNATGPLILIAILLAFGLGLYIRTFRTKRAAFKVIEIFYKHNALMVNDAKTRHELGLEPRDLLQRMTRPRDYKHSALHILTQRGIICEDGDGRLYMDETRLDQDVRRKIKEAQSIASGYPPGRA